MELRVGGKYRLIKKIGSGAFGIVYQGIYFLVNLIGINLKSNEEVAIKLVMLM